MLSEAGLLAHIGRLERCLLFSSSIFHKQGIFKIHMENQCYQYTCLPNGLSSAPRVFTKLLKPVFSTLRKKSFESVTYIDDILLLGDSFEHCAKHVGSTSTLLDSLGFTIHPTKSVMVPVQEIAFLGFLYKF